MSGDPGLNASPWMDVALDGRAVSIDGVPVQADGTAEGRYLFALHQIAAEVATPLGRRVGVTVTDGRGVVSHLAVHPDGTVDSIEELVRSANEPVVVPAPRAGGGAAAPSTRQPWVVLGSRRRLIAVVAAVVAAASAVVAAPLLDGRSGDVASSSIGDAEPADAGPDSSVRDTTSGGSAAPGAASSVAAEAVAHDVVAAPVLRLRVVLAARVVSDLPCQFSMVAPATSRSVRARVTVVTGDGQVLVRRFRLGPDGPATLVLEGLTPGVTRWTLAAPGAVPTSGRLSVMPLPPEAAAAPAVAPAPTAAPAAAAPAPAPSTTGRNSGGGGGNGGGDPQADPVVPIDPDDQ